MSLLGSDLSSHLKLLSRNEGKLKSYDSCVDVRAWSHLEQARSDHLREWIKCDMPICVLPVCTLTNFFRAMTCRSRARTTPRCHPDCKSKVLIDCLCTSCHAINECLKCNPKLDKYFAENELETSHWPCDKCLEVLKSIKMFWKIIIEKVFGINMSKAEEFEIIQSDSTGSVKSVAKLWEREIVQQAMFVRNVSPLFHLNKNNSFLNQTPIRTKTTTRISIPSKTLSKAPSVDKVKSPTRSFVSQKSRVSDMGRSSYSFSKNTCRPTRRVHRCTSVKLKTRDVSCTCDLDKANDDIISYKLNVTYLQQKCNVQEIEIEKLKRENNSLKYELSNAHKTIYDLPKRHAFINAGSNCEITALVPKPFESSLKNSSKENVFNNADSEMIITMKSCRHESFQHVSLLQILHKTNDPLINEKSSNASGCKKQNPVELLTKVRNTFGEIVKREIQIVSSKQQEVKHDIIKATFCKVNKSKSAPSCSTLPSDTISSDFNFEST